MMILVDRRIIADHVESADTFWRRLIGLMGRKQLNQGEGLLLLRCSLIHCFFMKIAIDAVYLSSDMKVLFIESLKPWEIGRFVQGAKNVLELPFGYAAGKIQVGDGLAIQQDVGGENTDA